MTYHLATGNDLCWKLQHRHRSKVDRRRVPRGTTVLRVAWMGIGSGAKEFLDGLGALLKIRFPCRHLGYSLKCRDEAEIHVKVDGQILCRNVQRNLAAPQFNEVMLRWSRR